MKRMVSMLLVFLLVLSLTACGGAPGEEPLKETAAQSASAEETLSPREQFDQIQAAMNDLQEGKTPETEEAKAETEASEQVSAIEYSVLGISLTLDSSFKDGSSDMKGWYTSDVFTVAVSCSNWAGKTAEEIAEGSMTGYQKMYDYEISCEVLNGVPCLVVPESNKGAFVEAYYADGSGSYWTIKVYSPDYDLYAEQMIEFATSGRIN